MRMLRRFGLLLLALGFTVAACDDNPTEPAPRRFIATLTGANERPNPVTTTATGTMTMTVPVGSNQMTWSLNITNWPTDGRNPTLSHIHRGGPDQSAGFFVNFSPTFNVSGSTVTANGTVAVPDSLFTLVATNLAYVNVHSSANPGGEVRGQVVQQ